MNTWNKKVRVKNLSQIPKGHLLPASSLYNSFSDDSKFQLKSDMHDKLLCYQHWKLIYA